MKAKYCIFFLGLAVLASGCSIFKPGCHCPHVVSAAHPKGQAVKTT